MSKNLLLRIVGEWAKRHRMNLVRGTLRRAFERHGEEGLKEEVVKLFSDATVEDIADVASGLEPRLQELVVKEAKRLLRVRDVIGEIVWNAKDG